MKPQLVPVIFGGSRGTTPFTPARLFTSGVAGAWYDPSDYSTLFQNSAGTTPVTAVEQPVGLMLDKSQGLVVGSELFSNPELSPATGWIVTTGVAISGGVATFSSGTTVYLYQDNVPGYGSGQFFEFQVVVSSYTSGSLYAFAGNTGLNRSSAMTAVGTYTLRVSCGTDASPQNGVVGDSFRGVVDFVSCKRVAGNNAVQSTSASRPILRARYNLLTYSEQFDNAAWTKSNATVTANQTTAPDGTTTADLAVATVTSGAHTVQQNTIAVGGGTGTISWRVKPAGYSKAGIRESTTTGFWSAFNLSGAGSVIATHASVTATISLLDDGWYLITQTTSGATSQGSCIHVLDSGYTSGSPNSYNFAGDGTSGIYIWGADLRTGSSAGTYQRIAAATDYATAGFAAYLAFDGVDDFLSAAYVQSAYPLTITAGINTDASVAGSVGIVSVAQSDIQYKALRDMSSNGTDANDRNGGNLDTSDIIVSGNKFVLSQFETSLITQQVNSGTANTAANTNAFGTSVNIFVGKSRPAGLFSAARDYGVVITNSVLSADQVASLRSWMGQKMGVTL